jgi:hypothetical protein
MHFSLSHTLAVVSQEPLRSVPNFPEDKVQTGEKQGRLVNTQLVSTQHQKIRGDDKTLKPHLCFYGLAA